jgi:hypothetical protein
MWLNGRIDGTTLKRVTRTLAAVAVGGTLLGCGDTPSAGGNGWTGTVDTLDSGRLMVTNPESVTRGDGELWKLREVFRLGAIDGDRPDVFGDIVSVELGLDGQLYVLDMQASEIRAFGPGGEHLRTFGRPGPGPGEMNYAAGMALDPDGILWVLNWGNRRYTGFDPATGDVVTEIRRIASFTSVPWPGRFDRTGRLLDVSLGSDGKPAAVRLDAEFLPRDTLALPEADPSNTIHFRRNGVSVMSVLDPFAPRPVWAPDPFGGIMVGEGDRYRLHRIGIDGDTVMTVEVPWIPVPVGRAERDSALAVFHQIADGARGAMPDRRPRVPDFKPVHGQLFLDDDGNTWVQRTAKTGSTTAWDVVNEKGRWLGQVFSPVEPTHVLPSVRGNRMAIVALLDGVPTVVVFDLDRATRAT